ncbi:MAG: carboxymuconolactone decarboxylase family protein [Acidimicrobiales bacterium]|nr:carboxymuconolactone decarboxylase family protein [Acidimicrobiales bacterium]
MTEPRIPPLDINNLDADAAAILQPMIDAGRPWNIFLTLAKHPDLAKRWLVFSNHVLFKSTLPPRERELAILRIGWLCQSEYEWAQHKIIGSDAGLEAEEIEKIKDMGLKENGANLIRLCLKPQMNCTLKSKSLKKHGHHS